VSTGSAESIAVSSLVAYDIYRQYINPEATGDQILFVSRVVIVVFGLFMGCFSLVLYELGLNLGWVYLFMGIIIGSAVAPMWNLMTWKKASGTGAVIAAWSGLFLAITGWLVAAHIQSGEINVDTLGTNEVMLSGNLIAILSSAFIHWSYSTFIDPQDYDFDDLDNHISLVEEDLRGLTAEEQDPVALAAAERWIKVRGYALTVILIFIWPLMSVPAGVFTKSYFAFWVLVAILWGFGAAIIISKFCLFACSRKFMSSLLLTLPLFCSAILPLSESSEDINTALSGMYHYATGTEPTVSEDPDEKDPNDTTQPKIQDDIEKVEVDSAESEVQA
jgi:hypothetical protein